MKASERRLAIRLAAAAVLTAGALAALTSPARAGEVALSLRLENGDSPLKRELVVSWRGVSSTTLSEGSELFDDFGELTVAVDRDAGPCPGSHAAWLDLPGEGRAVTGTSDSAADEVDGAFEDDIAVPIGAGTPAAGLWRACAWLVQASGERHAVTAELEVPHVEGSELLVLRGRMLETRPGDGRGRATSRASVPVQLRSVGYDDRGVIWWARRAPCQVGSRDGYRFDCADLAGPTSFTRIVGPGPGGRLLIAGHSNTLASGSTWALDPSSGRSRMFASGFAAVSADGKRAASAVRWYRRRGGLLLRLGVGRPGGKLKFRTGPDGPDIGQVAFSPDSRRLAVAEWRGARQWVTVGRANGTARRRIMALPPGEDVVQLAFTPAGVRLLVLTSRKRLLSARPARPARARLVSRGVRAIAVDPASLAAR